MSAAASQSDVEDSWNGDPDDLTPDAIAATARRIAPHVRRTPVLVADVDTDDGGVREDVVLKLEQLQHTGSFKPRGVFAHLTSRRVPGAGVVAASGGNHGAAVAYAAARLGHPAHVFVPATSSPTKRAAIARAGAQTHVGGAEYAEAAEAAEAWRRRTGALQVHAYDAPATLLGQGTLAAELDDQAELDTVLVAVGGGGLLGGMASWWRGRVRLVAVEAESCATLGAALAAGRPVDVPVSGLAADSLGARRIGALGFGLARAHVDRAVTVTDAQIAAAQRWAWTEAHLALEPGGAAALAALRSGAYRPAPGERVGVVLCGANVDLSTLPG